MTTVRRLTRALSLAPVADITLLRPDATRTEVANLCSAAVTLGAAAVCVSPTMLPLVELAGTPVAVCTVVGFPSGAHTAGTKANEARAAVGDGADEIDMVINLGAVKARNHGVLTSELAAVRAAAGTAVLKVILETAALTPAELRWVGHLSIDAGADYLKTSTGFHPAGGASIDTVAELAALATAAGRPIGVKASGGIRSYDDARMMLDAGATRLGVSNPDVLAPTN